MQFATKVSLQRFRWSLVRPLLYVRLWYFRALVDDTVYLPPVDVAPAPTGADRVLLIGSVEAMRVGVVSDELTTLSQVASRVAGNRHRPFSWIYTGSPVRTIRHAAHRSAMPVALVDATVLVFGFSDVLLMTDVDRWEQGLLRLVSQIRAGTGRPGGIVIAGLAPMDEFRFTARFGRRGIRQQVARLNAASERVAARVDGCVFVPPPAFPQEHGRPGDEQYSWALIHRMWGAALAPAVSSALNEGDLSCPRFR